MSWKAVVLFLAAGLAVGAALLSAFAPGYLGGLSFISGTCPAGYFSTTAGNVPVIQWGGNDYGGCVSSQQIMALGVHQSASSWVAYQAAAYQSQNAGPPLSSYAQEDANTWVWCSAGNQYIVNQGGWTCSVPSRLIVIPAGYVWSFAGQYFDLSPAALSAVITASGVSTPAFQSTTVVVADQPPGVANEQVTAVVTQYETCALGNAVTCTATQAVTNACPGGNGCPSIGTATVTLSGTVYACTDTPCTAVGPAPSPSSTPLPSPPPPAASGPSTLQFPSEVRLWVSGFLVIIAAVLFSGAVYVEKND